MLKPGDKIDRFRIEEPLGEGGMGRVFRAYDERLDRRVAIKVLVRDEDPDARTRLVREARAVAQLDHPNVVAVYDVGEVEGSPYIAMELVQGRSLRSIVGDANVGAGMTDPSDLGYEQPEADVLDQRRTQAPDEPVLEPFELPAVAAD